MSIYGISLQCTHIKRRYPDALIMVRVGERFEAFDDGDIQVLCSVLHVRARRREGVPHAGFAYSRQARCLQALLDCGHRVALVEPTSTPSDFPAAVDTTGGGNDDDHTDSDEEAGQRATALHAHVPGSTGGLARGREGAG